MPVRRLEVLLFILCWLVFAYFNQGGGWNQNSRFAEIRAIAEQGRFSIDDFLVYQRNGDEIQRLPVRNAEYDWEGKHRRLCWVSGTYELFPVGDHPVGDGVEQMPMIEVCSSGDVSYVPHTGHFHPNKPPGTSFMALPAYFVVYQLERLLGINPDHWWTMNANAWLTTIFSVGLFSALGCVLFFRLAEWMSEGNAEVSILATIAFAFGTTFFPFGTILFDHALTAVLLVAAFYFLRLSPRPLIAGACAGMAVVTNYVAVGAVAALGLYALLSENEEQKSGFNLRRAFLFSLGGLPLAALLLFYNKACFGAFLEINNNFQNPLFRDSVGFLGMFGQPNPYVVALLIASPYRGVFCLAPVLIMGIYGWVVWLRERKFVAEARLGIAIFGFFFLVNASFNGYHAGFSAGPRYIVPGLPFLALPLVVAFVRFRRRTVALLGISLFQQFLLVATDAQNSLAVGGHARIDDNHRKDDFLCSIVYEYAVPLFVQGQVRPLLNQMVNIKEEEEGKRLNAEGSDPATREANLAAYRAELIQSIERFDPQPFPLAAIRGPVSVNPVGVYDGLLGFGLYSLDAEPSFWASCNAGEFLFPRSRISVVPILAAGIIGFAFLMRLARRGAKLPDLAAAVS